MPVSLDPRAAWTLALLAIVLAGGCLTSPTPGTPTDATTTAGPTAGSGSQGPPNSVQIARLAGEYPVVNDTGFHYTGAVHANLNDVGDTVFRNVTLCLYDEEWNVVSSTDLGTFAAGENAVPVEVHTTTVPTWVIVEHPAFREESVYDGVLVRDGGRYAPGERADVNRSAPSQSGTCR